MELIKRLKEAESQAQQIIEQAKLESAKLLEESREKRKQVFEQAEQARRKAIEEAVKSAEEQGRSETETLNQDAERNYQQLRERTSHKTESAVSKVMEYIKG